MLIEIQKPTAKYGTQCMSEEASPVCIESEQTTNGWFYLTLLRENWLQIRNVITMILAVCLFETCRAAGKQQLVDALAFPVFRLVGCIILLVWGCGLSLRTWNTYGVNAIKLFELPHHNATGYTEVFNLAWHLTYGFLSMFLIFNLIRTKTMPRHMHVPQDVCPLLLVVYVAAMITRAVQRQSLRLSMGRALQAPFVPVTFFHTFFADWLTSLVRPFQDLLYTFMFVVTGRAFGRCDPSLWQGCEGREPLGEGLNNDALFVSVVLPFISAFPLWVRLMQCLRRYRDTGERMPHLANAVKYQFGLVVVFFGTFSPNLYSLDSHISRSHTIFIAVCTVSTFYTYTWDVLQDWGLGDKQQGWLRSILLYPNRACYFVAIFTDFFLRYLWVLSLVPHNRKDPFGAVFNNMFSPFFGIVEFGRRTMWGLLRVENEHLIVSEAEVQSPKSVEDIRSPRGILQDDREESIVCLLEIMLLTAVVILSGVIAFMTEGVK